MTRDLPPHSPIWLWLWGGSLVAVAALGVLVTSADENDRVEAIAFFVVALAIVLVGRQIMSPPSSHAQAFLVQLHHLRAVIAAQVLVAFSAMTFYLALGALSASFQPATETPGPMRESLPSLLIVSLLLWLIPGLAWFGVTGQIARIEVAQAERQRPPTTR